MSCSLFVPRERSSIRSIDDRPRHLLPRRRWHFGADGTTSASDGQRFAMPNKVLQRTYSTCFNTSLSRSEFMELQTGLKAAGRWEWAIAVINSVSALEPDVESFLQHTEKEEFTLY